MHTTIHPSVVIHQQYSYRVHMYINTKQHDVEWEASPVQNWHGDMVIGPDELISSMLYALDWLVRVKVNHSSL